MSKQIVIEGRSFFCPSNSVVLIRHFFRAYSYVNSYFAIPFSALNISDTSHFSRLGDIRVSLSEASR